MKLLENKKALVTGSSRGIGRKIAEVFMANGAEVWGLCTKPSAAKADLEKVAADNGVKFHEICCNCGDAAALKECIKAALEEAGGFDVLVNNAGITRDGLSFAMSMENWQDVINVNLTAPFVINQIISYDMIHKKKGSIINMASISGVHGEAGQVNYSASKAGLIGMTKALAKEIGKRKVRVNAVAPGFIETEMTEAVPEELRKEWLKIIPMNRAGTVEEVANVCLFLASDLSTYVTGQVIGIDGGMGA
ncbi:MAG: 3-oxoacyl-[acyl-carrier-protein] reductase [Treponema sp.]|uniref:3-oxoacyl-[acyl-carrier-protein] reductase n=2 Tax=Treponema sp. TaxID=166 RepID=UPI001B74A866|nr:3-oxoacyl-[acyl-carrier-protein] reductase [Treponema sp.]MBP5588055.1 3-oxoacyl-[acyl-carrier-protein] reductase [Treponema sp.]MBR0155243.1 3-oxoacyl-[acyl-carrier-protein] reductase [Treponema sp.]MCR5386714.1 3-oxoacyl-[acyl-carrier-protein] reductase [Treponema sp.]